MLDLGPKLTLDKIVSYGAELFASSELKLAEALVPAILGDIKVNPGEMVLVVSLDRNVPTYSVEPDGVVLRFNLRFYPPSRTSDGTPIDLKPEDWSERLQKALQGESIKYHMGGVAQLIKCTLFLNLVDYPKAQEPAAEEPKVTDEAENTEEETPDETETSE